MNGMFEKINLTEALVVVFAGVALIAAVVLGQENIASAIGGGLVGYLGAVVTVAGKDNGKEG